MDKTLLIQLLHPKYFAELLSSSDKMRQESNKQYHIESLLKQLEASCASEFHSHAASIMLDATITNAAYDWELKRIQIPYNSNAQGVVYFLNWAHESEHHRQLTASSPDDEQTMIHISCAINIPHHTILWKPSKEYASNYNEILARTAATKAILDAYDVLDQCYDFTIEHRKQFLTALQDHAYDMSIYASQFDIKFIQKSNQRQIRKGQYDPDAVPNLTPQQMSEFLEQNGERFYKQAFENFQQFRIYLSQLIQRIQQEIGPDKEQTLARQQAMEQRYHQRQNEHICVLAQQYGIWGVVPSNYKDYNCVECTSYQDAETTILHFKDQNELYVVPQKEHGIYWIIVPKEEKEIAQQKDIVRDNPQTDMQFDEIETDNLDDR